MSKITPIVTIVVITYNHCKYIRQAMDSFLAQETNFVVEILVHDDASTDGTREILKDYKDMFPDRVRLLLEKENQFSKTGAKFLEGLYTQAKGKYIAVCEGDDYWTDPRKLQQQVDYLERRPEYTICFHPVVIQREDTGEREVFPTSALGHTYTLKELLQHNYIQTNSVMYRNLNDYKGVCPDGVLPQDWFTHIFHARYGKIGFINKPMGVYRRHADGMWWQDADESVRFWQRNAIRHIRLFENIERLFTDNEEYLKIIYYSAGELIGRICHEVGESDNFEIATQIATTFPRYAAMTITQNVSEGSQPQLQLKKVNTIIKNLEDENSTLKRDLEVCKTQLDAVIGSKSWRITEPMRKIHETLKHNKSRP